MSALDVINDARRAARAARVQQTAGRLARGASIDDVAIDLDVSPTTVRAYLSDPDGQKARARAARRRAGLGHGHAPRSRRADELREAIAKHDATAIANDPRGRPASSRIVAGALGISASRVRDYRSELDGEAR